MFKIFYEHLQKTFSSKNSNKIPYLCLAANVAANEQDKELRIKFFTFFMNIFKRLFCQKTSIKYLSLAANVAANEQDKE